MSEIINFIDHTLEKSENVIWVCDCGNCSFLIYQDGRLECSDCGELQNGCDAHYQTMRKWTRKKRED